MVIANIAVNMGVSILSWPIVWYNRILKKMRDQTDAETVQQDKIAIAIYLLH